MIGQYAKSFLGTPYCWGGDSPKTGFDCSGFVVYVFGHFGMKLLRELHDPAPSGRLSASPILSRAISSSSPIRTATRRSIPTT
ncbi:C40 family peptidase [Alicyclobacillus sendaiensis]|uniref:C40 family peptidase n=1 Tax=Alicyclobacillus sendaiensis TaxID=192387 RepID=UPI001FDED448|nr:NlpC/P60 family protein [Alicyclobacillus sendaiensis]